MPEIIISDKSIFVHAGYDATKEPEEHALISYLKYRRFIHVTNQEVINLLMTNNSGTTVFVCLDEGGAGATNVVLK